MRSGKKALYLVSLLATLSLASHTYAGTLLQAQLEDTPKKVIFFGNSFTYYNNSLHYHLEQMVRSTTPKDEFTAYKFRAITISGGKLTEHKSVFPALIDMELWDAVILQGHSREAIAENMAPAFHDIATEMVQATRKAGGTPLLFMTWAYQNKPEMIDNISKAYTQLGRELGALVVPVGLAFERALSEQPNLKLHASDRVHPSPAGTYLAACTFYAVLYGKSPVGNAYNMWLKPEQARQLQEIAWYTVQNYHQPIILHQIDDKILVQANPNFEFTQLHAF